MSVLLNIKKKLGRAGHLPLLPLENFFSFAFAGGILHTHTPFSRLPEKGYRLHITYDTGKAGGKKKGPLPLNQLSISRSTPNSPSLFL